MATDWTKLRPLDGSQEKGFEELCCQLAASERYSPGATFVRKGTPDAGVECFWTLPGGDEHGWQAKFFLSPPAKTQWEQLDESVETALKKHSRLTRYTVCLPIDRPDPRNEGQKSFLEKWAEHVSKWERSASKRRMKVEFDFWGNHELLSRMSWEEHRGRHWFWFNRDELTLDWFRKNLAVAINNAGERYTPVLHVDLPIARYFAAAGRTPAFYESVNELYIKNRENARFFVPSRTVPEAKEAATIAQAGIAELSMLLDQALRPMCDADTAGAPEQIPWDNLKRIVDPLFRRLSETSSDLWALIHERETKKTSPPADGTETPLRALQDAAAECRKLRDSVEELAEFCDGKEAAVANRPAVLLVGDPGQGKTHLLCDIANKDLRDGRPRILLYAAQFKDCEPWVQIIQMLRLTCTPAEFLGALNAAGQAYRCRILIFIDALNEGEGRALWEKHLPGMLAEIAESSWVGLVVSIRSTYESSVIPNTVAQRLTRLVHHGFDEHESAAVHRFFTHFGIQPTSPLLLPEFRNPLFLKLFCQSLKDSGLKQVPLGLRGITSIVNMFLDSVNAKLAHASRMNYDRKSNLVRKAADIAVKIMGETKNQWLPRDRLVADINALLPVSGFDRSLFQNLVSEGVFGENQWHVDGEMRDIVHFAYERFGDHLLASHLFDISLDVKGSRKKFKPRSSLMKWFASEETSWRYGGLLEALAIQLPERAGSELFEVLPRIGKNHQGQSAFLASLPWRESRAFSKATFRQLEDMFPCRVFSDAILNAMITVAPIPDHPLNADKLHKILSQRSMADRDAWWSVYLFSQWHDSSSVHRLVEWTWAESGHSSLSDAVAILTGNTLAWFLTSSHRFLRDRTTKAIVRLFENRLPLLRALLDHFWTVNDPYVLERLLAAACGAALRSRDLAGLAELATDIANNVFDEKKTLPQLLTRDYARTVIAFARHRGAIPADALPQSHPPYSSTWPKIKIPSSKAVERWGKWYQGMPDTELAKSEIYSSLMRDGISDFSRYVIGDLHEWTTIPLGSSPPKSTKDQVNEFMSSLTAKQRKAVESYKFFLDNTSFFKGLSAEERVERFKDNISDQAFNELLQYTEQEAIKSLAGKPADQQFFIKTAKPYYEVPYRRDHEFDAELARRWMVQRVIDYGWTTERFGAFDRMVQHTRSYGREASKPERIGKKYQWIAYHELLARLADNFYVRRDLYSDSGVRPYEGHWDLGCGFRRDLDPTLLIRSTAKEVKKPVWWSPVGIADWLPAKKDDDWLTVSDDLPELHPLVSVQSPDGVRWLVLDVFCNWKQPAQPGRKEYDQRRRSIWYIIRSYLVRRADGQTFFRWAKKQDFMNRWMPEPRDIFTVHLGEFFWSESYKSSQENGWTRDDGKRCPTDVLVTCHDYVCESSGFDCSLGESVRIGLPTKSLVDGMGLKWAGVEGQLEDAKGRVAIFDPCVFESGPQALLVREDALRDYLSKNELDIVWTLLGEKQMVGGGHHDRDNHPGWMQISGAYKLASNGIVGNYSTKRVPAHRS